MSTQTIRVLATFLAGFALSVAAGAQAGVRTFSYDQNGNRTAATNQVRFTTTSAFSVYPRRALIGELVNVRGRNFPAGQPGQVAITFGGVAATVLSVSTRIVTVEVPAAAQSGPVAIAVGGGQPQQIGNVNVTGVQLTPDEVTLAYGATQQFQANVIGGNPAVSWSVNGIPGGNSQVGTINITGLYTAPAASTSEDFPFLISAYSADLGFDGYAVVKPECVDRGAVGNRSFAAGTLSAAYEQHCWSFDALASNLAYIAVIGSSNLRSLTLRRSNGVAIASAGPGQTLKLGDFDLVTDEELWIHVEADSQAGTTYQLWHDQHAPLPDGHWLFPGSGNWQHPDNWSNDVVPGSGADVTIADLPGDLTVTVSSGSHQCSSITSDEALSLTGGRLGVAGNVQVNATFTLQGGTLADATVLAGSGGELLQITPNSNNRLDSVKLMADLELNDTSDRVRIAGNLDIDGVLRMRANGTSVIFEGSQSIVQGEVAFEGTSGWRYLEMQGVGTLTIAPGVSVHGSRGNIGAPWWQGGGQFLLDNRGTISADVPGRILRISAVETHNLGTLESRLGAILEVNGLTGPVGSIAVNDAGSVLSLDGVNYVVDQAVTVPNATMLDFDGTWSNQSSMTVNGGVVNLGGIFTTAGIGTLTNNSGVVNFTGNLDNSGATLTLSSGGSWNLSGGSITNGTVDLQGGASLGVSASSSNRVDSVAVQGDIHLAISSARLRVAGNLDVDGTVTMSGSSSSIAFEGSQSITAGTIVFSGNSNRYVEMQSAGTLTVLPGVTLRGNQGRIGASWWHNAPMTLVNQGTISAEVSGRTTIIQAADTTNQGHIEAIGGGRLEVRNSFENAGTAAVTGSSSRMTFSDSWTNTGALTITAGTMNFGGTFLTSALGTYTNNGGTVNLLGVLQNTGSTLTLDGTTGSWNLSGGTILGGTVNLTGGTALQALASSSNRLDDVTILGDLDLAVGSARVRVAGDLDVSGTVTMAGNGSSLAFEGSQSIVSGDIVFTGNVNHFIEMQSAGTLTIPAGVSLSGGRANIGTSWWYNAPMTLVNQGTITANTNALSILIDAETATNENAIEATGGGRLVFRNTFTNAGAVVAGAGSRLTFEDTWTNTGSITLNGATANLDGTFQTSALGTYTNNGGTVNLLGVLQNTGSTLTLDGTTGSWNLNGGTIQGGTVNLTGGTALQALASSGNRLDDVTILGDLDLAVGSARVRVAGDLDVSGTVTMSGNGSSIAFEGSQSIVSGDIVFIGNVNHFIEMQSAGTLTIPAGISLSGGRANIGTSWWHAAPMTLVNQGTITATTSGQSVIIDAASATNENLIEATGGGRLVFRDTFTNAATIVAGAASIVTFEDSWTNAGGTVTLNGATMNLDGTFPTSALGSYVNNGGTINLEGALTNTGATLTLDATTGSWNLNGGTIAGGTVALTGSTTLRVLASSNNRLDDVTINGDVDLAVGSARVRVAGDLDVSGTVTMSGNGSSLAFEGSQSIVSGEIVFAGNVNHYVEMHTTGTLTIPAGITIRGERGNIGGSWWFNGAMTLVNQGTIVAETASRTVTLGAGSVENQGTLDARAGATLAATGSFTQTAAGTLAVDLAGTAASQFGRLTVVGAATLDGTLDVETTGGYTPVIGHAFPVVTWGARTGTFATILGTNLGGGRTLQPSYNGNDLTLTVQ